LPAIRGIMVKKRVNEVSVKMVWLNNKHFQMLPKQG
jgi:hypothetical protein